MTTFVALGDSTTAGFGDPRPDGVGWRGWAALLAEGLGPGVAFHNLAVSGACARDVAEAQLPAALALRPGLAAVLVGVNDTLRGDFDVARTGLALDETVGSLRGAGAAVLTGCLPDPGRMFRLPAALARPLGRRIRALNAVAHRLDAYTQRDLAAALAQLDASQLDVPQLDAPQLDVPSRADRGAPGRPVGTRSRRVGPGSRRWGRGGTTPRANI